MVYVMSDLHGRYDKYSRMLEKIRFSDEDELYLIGDICDRGPDPAQIYLDAMSRKNVHCIMGNHEKMLLEALPHSFWFLTEHGHTATLELEIWTACGGGTTCASLLKVGPQQVLNIYNYICSFPLYRSVEVEGRRFLLVHAGIDQYDEAKPLDGYSPEDLLWFGFDPDGTYYPQRFDKIIVGHTPTFLMNYQKPIAAFHGDGNVIDIDCGAVFEESDGRLCCLCLNTMEEFYV